MVSQRHTTTFRKAVKRCCLSVRAIAKELGIAEATLAAYVYMEPPSARVAVKLRTWLERYARELQQVAAKLPAKEGKRP